MAKDQIFTILEDNKLPYSIIVALLESIKYEIIEGTYVKVVVEKTNDQIV